LIQKEFSVRDGILNGTKKLFEEKGNVAISEVQYGGGKIHGLNIRRHSNGMLSALLSYTNDVEEGIGLMFFDDGRLASIYNNKGTHLKIKYSKVWDENGNLLQYAFYDDCMNPTGGVVLVGYDGKGKREVFDEGKRQKMTVEDFQKSLTEVEKYQPKIWELPKFFSLDPEIIAILDKEWSLYLKSLPPESVSQFKGRQRGRN
jgi:antitoxin component YwqK of YwqJK toxin-antitoxin module